MHVVLLFLALRYTCVRFREMTPIIPTGNMVRGGGVEKQNDAFLIRNYEKRNDIGYRALHFTLHHIDTTIFSFTKEITLIQRELKKQTVYC